jgi:Na+/proline symporter
MLSVYDYAVIGVYFAFMLVIGVVFHRKNRTTSDFFRGGGKMLWWIVGATAFMTQFSAWTFTGAASKAYETGALVLAIYFGSALGFFCNFLGTASRLRQMRVITMFEAVRLRWGRRNEQFFTWLQLPVGTLLAGIALNGLGVILASVFGLDIRLTMLGAGLVVIFMATFGGSWAATAGDFMQMLMLMAVTTAAALLALHEVGGVSGFMARLPEQSFTWGNTGRPEIIAWWFVALALTQVVATNNMSDGYRYLGAKDDRHARRGALLASVLFIVGPIVWFVPPMVARILFPDLSVVPALQPLGVKASEGAYLAVGIATMPRGMVGLMITSLFAATISNMDTGLNKNAGIFVRSFYHPVLRPQADERELMIASRAATLFFGVMTLLAAFAFRAMSHLSLFNLMQQFVSLVMLPVAMPLLWGLFVRRVPPWSGWSTVAVCLLASLLVGNLDTIFGADAYQRMLAVATPLAHWEQPTAVFSLGVVTNVVVGTIWFLATSLWYRRQPAAYHEQVDAFFTTLKTPIDFACEQGGATDGAQLRLMGRLGVAYGGFVLLLVLIPNPPLGRAAFGFVGAVIGGVGAWLLRTARRAAPDK